MMGGAFLAGFGATLGVAAGLVLLVGSAVSAYAGGLFLVAAYRVLRRVRTHGTPAAP